MIHVPAWLQLGTVAAQAYGLKKAGDGWAHGWLVTATVTAAWQLFAVVTHQWWITTGLVLVAVQVRNACVRPRGGDAPDAEAPALARPDRP